MVKKRRESGKFKLYWFYLLSLLFLLSFSSSCPKREKLTFGREDTLSVLTELGLWRDTLRHYQFLEFGERPLVLRTNLTSNDTIYQKKPELRKIASLLSFWRTTQDTAHFDSLHFFVDSLSFQDTFCSVLYNDSTRHTIAIFKYDSLWLVKFRDSVTIETITKIGYSLPQEKEKIYPLVGKRRLIFQKEGKNYKLKKISGFHYSYPLDSAPILGSITLSQEGKSIVLEPKDFPRLISLDSLPSFSAREALLIDLACERPGDTLNLKYLGFLYNGQERVFLGLGYNLSGSLTFPEEGVSHLFIEILSSTNFFYPENKYYYTILALPLRITQ